MKLNCSWDDLAIVVGGGPDSRNRDRVVTCIRLATDDEELELRRLGLDWGGWLWRVNHNMAWVDEWGADHWLPFAPDARLRRLGGIDPVVLAEAVAA